MTTEWTVVVDFDADLAVSPRQLDELSDLADEHDVTVAARKDGGFILIGAATATDPIKPTTDLAHHAMAWAARLGMRTSVAAVHAQRSSDAERAALNPTIPALASAADVASILGVSRQRVHQLAAQHPQFPAPVTRVALGPLWTEDAIRWFADVWQRKPGRPATKHNDRASA